MPWSHLSALKGCVNPETLYFLEIWLSMCGYWGRATASQVPLSKVGICFGLGMTRPNFWDALKPPQCTKRVCKSWNTVFFRDLIICVWLLRKSTSFLGPIVKSRTCFGLGMTRPNFWDALKPPQCTKRVCKSWNTVFFRDLIIYVWLLRKRNSFPGPIVKSRTCFGLICFWTL